MGAAATAHISHKAMHTHTHSEEDGLSFFKPSERFPSRRVWSPSAIGTISGGKFLIWRLIDFYCSHKNVKLKLFSSRKQTEGQFVLLLSFNLSLSSSGKSAVYRREAEQIDR